MQRPDWSQPRYSPRPVDLSTNVHYDRWLSQKVSSILKDIDVSAYPDEYHIYECLANEYHLPINRLAVGFGATELLDRSIRTLKYNKLWIVGPSFEMISVYCQLHGISHEKIDYETAISLNCPEDAVYMASPDGQTGASLPTRVLLDRFKFCFIDEVYADFFDQHSLIRENRPNLLIFKSISKTLGLAGLRLGFVISSEDIIAQLQQVRLNHITTAVNTKLIPKIIPYTGLVISRMIETKEYLENNFQCVPSLANYVLFREPNRFTDRFGCKKINGLYRMALCDMETLHESH